MDIARPELKRQKRRRQILWASMAAVVLIGVTVGVSRLRPAAPTVDRSTIWTDTVKRGSMLRQVRGLGTLIPSHEDVRQIPAETEATVIRIVKLPGSLVEPDTVLVEMSNPQLEQEALDAQLQVKAAEAEYQSLKVKLDSDLMTQRAGAATVNADSLHRFLQSYRKLAQMPSPSLQPVELRPLLERVAVLETRLNVEIAPGPERVLMIDPDLIEQMLINLVRNAVDAALEQAQSAHASSEPADPKVSMRWEQYDRKLALIVEDNGIGLLNPSNAFVPFYTTKPGGSGIGLVLSQQIAEAHGGSIELANRRDTRGCIVKVLLPYRPSPR